MAYPILETQQVTGIFDESERLVRVTYRGVLTADVTRQTYEWLGRLIAFGGGDISLARGSIYDFSAVTEFDNRNLTTAQRESSSLRSPGAGPDLSRHPVACVVSSLKQEQFVKLTMQFVGKEKRQQIVTSVDEGKAFIEAFLASLPVNP